MQSIDDIEAICERSFNKQLDDYLKNIYDIKYSLFLNKGPMCIFDEEKEFHNELDAEFYKLKFLDSLNLDKSIPEQKNILDFFERNIVIQKV